MTRNLTKENEDLQPFTHYPLKLAQEASVKTIGAPRDLTKENEDFAVLFPSVSSIYVKFTSRPDKLIPEGRTPTGLPNGAESLNFLNKEKGLFNYKYALYSAGHSEWNPEKSDVTESMIQKRDRKNTIVMGDSGGFQIAQGVGRFGNLPWAKDAQGRGYLDWSKDKKDTRGSILKWLEHTADLSMILDLPTAAIAKGNVKTFDDCLRNTLDNMDFFVKNREMGKTRFLNILQGLNDDQTEYWWNNVKNYPFEGWAFGGCSAFDFYLITKRMLQMRDGKYFEKHPDGWHARNWLHFLGVSRLQGAVAFTALQRTLRQKVDPSITISFDAASAFVAVAMGKIYTGYNTRFNRFGYSMDFSIDNKAFKGSTEPFPWQSTSMGRCLNIGDICVRGPKDTQKNGKETKTSWDSASYVFLMCQNVEMQLIAIQEANRLFKLPRKDSSQWVPGELYDFQEALNEIFQKENSHDTMTKYTKELNRASKTAFSNSELFKVEVLQKQDLLEKHRKLFENITSRLMGKGESSYNDLFTDEINEKHTGTMGGDEIETAREE
jgi:hypothetical protein